jgi:hypothetical protein
MSDAGGNRGVVASLADKVLTALPPAFLVLLAINAGFLWFESHSTAQRSALLDRVLDACMSRIEVK